MPGEFPPDEAEALLGRAGTPRLAERRPFLARKALELVLDMLKVPEADSAPDVVVTCTGSSRDAGHK